MDADDVLVEQPVLATAIVAGGTAAAYVGVQVVLDNRYLRQRADDTAGDDPETE